jgi:hypothetical protein
MSAGQAGQRREDQSHAEPEREGNQVKTRTVVLGAIVASTVALTAPAHAGQLVVENPGFELTQLNDGAFLPGAPDGWTVTKGVGVYNPTKSQFLTEAPEGFNTGYSNGGFLSQQLADELAANTSYALYVEVGNRLDVTFADYVVQLWAGSTLLAEQIVPVPAPGFFQTTVVTYDALAGDPALGERLEIRFRGRWPCWAWGPWRGVGAADKRPCPAVRERPRALLSRALGFCLGYVP